MKTGEITVKVKANVIANELTCIKCNVVTLVGEVHHDVSYLYTSLDGVVFDDYKCEKCGCNTFDVESFILVELEK